MSWTGGGLLAGGFAFLILFLNLGNSEATSRTALGGMACCFGAPLSVLSILGGLVVPIVSSFYRKTLVQPSRIGGHTATFDNVHSRCIKAVRKRRNNLEDTDWDGMR